MKDDELLQNENIYQQLVENLQDVLFVISPDWQTVYYISPSYKNVWGRTCNSLLKNPLSWLESIHPDDVDDVTSYVDEKSKDKLSEITFPDYRIIRPDDSVKWIKARGFPILNKQGIYRIAGVAEDITEQKEKEESLKLSEERLAMVLEGSEQGFWDWNIKTGIVSRNERWAQMLGYFTISEFEDNTDTWTNSIYPDDRDAAWASINNHLEGHTCCHDLEYRMLTKDGGFKWIHDHAQIVQHDANGAPLRMSGTHTDIFERKKMEHEKDELVNSLKEALAEIKDLRGIIPICSYCHNIRDEKGAWDALESYISKHTDAKFSHGICPKCLPKAMAQAGLDEKDKG